MSDESARTRADASPREVIERWFSRWLLRDAAERKTDELLEALRSRGYAVVPIEPSVRALRMAEALTDFTSVEGCEYDRQQIMDEIKIAHRILCDEATAPA
jgi:hypothetical protein